MGEFDEKKQRLSDKAYNILTGDTFGRMMSFYRNHEEEIRENYGKERQFDYVFQAFPNLQANIYRICFPQFTTNVHVPIGLLTDGNYVGQLKDMYRYENDTISQVREYILKNHLFGEDYVKFIIALDDYVAEQKELYDAVMEEFPELE